MGEGESCPARLRIQPPWILRTTGLAVPSPVGRERVRVRVFLFELRLPLGTYFCTNPKHDTVPLQRRPLDAEPPRLSPLRRHRLERHRVALAVCRRQVARQRTDSPEMVAGTPLRASTDALPGEGQKYSGDFLLRSTQPH